MASKVQQQLTFPVRKSSRQSKPSRIVQEAKEQASSSVQKPGVRSSRREATPQGRTGSAGRKQQNSEASSRDSTPQRATSAGRKVEASPCRSESTPPRSSSARRRDLNCPPGKRESTQVRAGQDQREALWGCRSPSKRKAASAVSPPTPPKSPCKSPGRRSVQHTPRCPSPEICSEESDSEEEGPSTPARFTRPHNASDTLLTPSKTAPSGQKASAQLSSPARRAPPAGKCTDGGELCDTLAGTGVDGSWLVKGPHALRTVCGQQTDAPPPPPSPPLSPPVPLALSRRPANESTTINGLPNTPTKATQCSHWQQNEGAQILGSPRTPHTTPHGHRTPRQLHSPFETPTAPPPKFSLCEQALSPHKHGSCTAQNTSRTLGPGASSPQKPQSGRKLLSPKKTARSPGKSLTSLVRKSASPRKSLMPGDEENFSLKSPKLLPKPPPAKPDQGSYQRAKQSLHTANPDQLVGREEEVGQVCGFLTAHLERRCGGSLYISGAPGTGKTAAVMHVLQDLKAQYTCHVAYVNCMMVKDVSSVFRRLHSELSGKPAGGRTSVRDMETLVTTSKSSMVLVLDEIDQLDSKNQEVLYTIFEWPSLRHSKLVLVGVANALDLTDRILPRLQAKPGCRPQLLHFAPYTPQQIAAVLHHRLLQTGGRVVEGSAIQLCARKVGAVAGDMRKALDVCRRAVELAQAETTVLTVTDCNSPGKRGRMDRVGVGHMARVLGEAYGSSVERHSAGVPVQQKVAVCTLLLLGRATRLKEVPLGKLHEAYCKVCRRQQMSPVDQSEFHSLCVLLEARGVIGLKKAKETRLIKVALRQDERELEQTLMDRVLVSAILADGLPK